MDGMDTIDDLMHKLSMVAHPSQNGICSGHSYLPCDDVVMLWW